MAKRPIKPRLKTDPAKTEGEGDTPDIAGLKKPLKTKPTDWPPAARPKS